MASRTSSIAVAVPGLCAVRWSVDELHTGVKAGYAIARAEVGRSAWWSRGRVWQSAPGSLLMGAPGDVCREVWRDGPGRCQIVVFPAAQVEATVGCRPLPLPPQLAAEDPRGAPFQRLHDAVAAGAERFALEVAIAEALQALATTPDDGARAPTRPVRRAMALLRDRLAEPLLLDALALHAGVNKFHLCRAFRAQVGLSPHAYLIRLRVLRAQELLTARVRPKDIAPQVGFYDQSQLNRHFRRIVGTTPGRYARSQ